MSRSYNSSYNNFEYGWRNSTIQDQQSDRKILDLIEKIRTCKPYLQKRLKVIEESGQLKLLREEVKDIEYWLEIAQEVRADIIYGVETLEVVHEKMMEMVRLHPIQGAFTTNRIDDSDDDSDSAPRSPSPGISGSEFSSSTRIIPLEKSQSENDYLRSKDFLVTSNDSSHRRSVNNTGFDPHRSDTRFNNDWGPGSPSNLEFSRRGDTDMRLDRYDAFNSANARCFGRGRGRGRPVEEPRVGTPDNHSRNSPWNNEGSSPWDAFRNVDRGRPRSRDHSDDSSRDFDYRDTERSRERSPDRKIFRDPRARPRDDITEHDRGRPFIRDQDFREYTRDRDISRDRSGDSDRSRESDRGGSMDRPRSRPHDLPNDRDWSRPNDRPIERDRPLDKDRISDERGFSYRDRSSDERSFVYRDRDLREQNRDRHVEHRRSDFCETDNRDNWSNSSVNSNSHLHLSAHNSNFNSADSNLPTMASFLMGQSMIGSPQQQNMGMMSPLHNVSLPNMNRQQQSNIGMIPRGMPSHSPNININSPAQSASSRNSTLNVAMGQHSPQQFHNSFQPRVGNPRQPLLPTPVNRTNMTSQRFGAHYPASPNQGNPPRVAMTTNIFDPATRTTDAADFADQFRQKAQQHFAKPPRPRHPPPGHTVTSPAPRPPVAGSNSITNPNLATNQIAADLPSDPRRRSQLQRQMQQQQQQQQQNSVNTTANVSIAPNDPRRQPLSPTKEKDKDKNKSLEKVNDSAVSNSLPTSSKKREGVSSSENSPLKSVMRRTVERVREAVAKEIPKTSKIQELRKSLSKQGFHRLGTKSKSAFEEASSEMHEEDEKDTDGDASVTKSVEKSGEESKTSDSSPGSNKTSPRDLRGRSDRGKDRKLSQQSDEDEVERKKRGTSVTATVPDEEDRDPRRKTRRTVQLESEAANKKVAQTRRSPSKSKLDKPIIPCPKIDTSFRIPKIKKPPPPAEPEPPPVEEEPNFSSVETSPPHSPEPLDNDGNDSDSEEKELLNEEPVQIPSSPKQPEPEPTVANKEPKTTIGNTAKPGLETDTSAATSLAESQNPGGDTDLLLRQFMIKSIGLSGDILEQIVSNPSAMDKIKSLLKNHVSEIVSKDPIDNSTNADNTESLRNKEGEEDTSEDHGRHVLSPEPHDEDELPCRSRSTARRKSHKRRSSLEKLHDALREMNFDAVLPLGPRRAANTRSQSEEASTSTEQHPMDNVAESIQNVIDNVIESGKEDLIPSQTQFPEESKEAEVEILEASNVPLRGKRGRKRKQPVKPAAVEKKRGRKPGLGGGVSVSAKAAIAAVAAIPDIEVSPTPAVPLQEENGVEKNEPSKPPIPPGNKKRGRRPIPKPTIVETSKSPKKNSSPVKPTRTLPVREPNPDGRVTRSMIKPAGVQINQGLGRVKLEADFIPAPLVTSKIEPPDPKENTSTDVTLLVTPEKQNGIKVKIVEKTPKVKPKIAVPAPVASADVEEQTVSAKAIPNNNMSVFLYDSKDDANVRECISSHDRLLNDAGTSLVVKKVFPENLFGEFIKNILTHTKTEAPVTTEQKKSSMIMSESFSDKITKECKETLEWMLSVLQFKSSEDCGIDSEENQDTSDLYNPPENNDTQPSVAKCMVDIDDNEDDDDEPYEDEYELDQEAVGGDSSVSNNRCNSPSYVEKGREQCATDPRFESKASSNNEDDDDINFPFSDFCPNNIFSKDDSEDMNADSPQDGENQDMRRKTDLAGTELYRCANENCGYKAATAATFKDHCLTCTFAKEGKLYCFHCERRLKSIVSLMEHLKIHGKPRQLCSLCNFRAWFASEITKHLKNAHKVYNCKVIKEGNEDEDPVHVMYPKEVANRLTLPNDLLQNHILYTSKVQFQPSEIDSVPKACIFTSLLHCAVCEYSTKVRSNIIRHLELHSRSEKDGGTTQVPNKAPVNPVPCLERKELMFDKMTNWAGSSHANKIGGVSKEDTLKLPKFVVDQFRYVCSVSSCKQITGQDDILCAHMKALHFKEKFYVCPHCQEEDGTKHDPRNSVLIEKIPHHLKLHGPRLSKCGHCDYIHYSSISMEKHVATKHVEKKPIFYLIRDLDNDGNALLRRTSVDDPVKGHHERWRCTLCRAHLSSWEDAKKHCVSVHKVKNQFECSYCHFGSDSIYAITSHLANKSCRSNQGDPKILIAFLRNEAFEGSDPKTEDGVNVPIWRRDAPRVKHIRGIFLDDENTRPSCSSSSAPKVSQPKSCPSSSSMSSYSSAAPKPPPVPIWLVCPKCNLFRSKTAIDLRIHLFNELNYLRYKCNICAVQFVTVDSLKAHMNLDHKVTVDDESKAMLPVNEKIESQVYEIISGLLNAQKANAEDKDGRNIENLLCKHCYLQFSSFHNYRTHVLAKHIGSERFKCKHCNAGFWHEAMVKQHHFKSSHSDKPLQVVRNNEFEQMLTPEFWFKEYGIPHNKSIKSASIGRPEDEDGSYSPSKYLKCSQCEFKTDSIAALQNHEAYHPLEGNIKRSYKRRSISTTSDTDKDDTEDSLKPPGAKKMLKNFKELSTVYKCDHCMVTNFTKRGIRSHWSRSHGMAELPCRYYECKSFDDNYKLTDGYVLKCSTCTFETSSIEHYQTHHEVDHPGKSFRFKRRKRNELLKSTGELADVVLCNYCHCEVESVKKLSNHSQLKHPGYPLDYKMMEVRSTQGDGEVSLGKFIEDNVIIECSICRKVCGSLKQYSSHFQAYHDNLPYVDPSMRFTRAYGNHEDSELAEVLPPPNPKISRIASANDDARTSHLSQESMTGECSPPKLLYKCPKCDFKSDNYDSLCSNHLITHLLAYRCPECNLAFHLLLDAQFHIRHFHGIPRIRPSHNGDAYVEFSALKDKITQVTVSVAAPPKRNVILVNLSDEEDFDDPSSFPIPNPEDLDELDVEDVRLLLG